MMARERRYWDSACFLAIMKNESRSSLCDGVIQAAEQGKTIIVTSTWALTEVISITGEKKMAESEDAIIRRFFEKDYIVLRPVTEKIGHLSRQLVWNYGYDTKDAIHVATALDAECSIMDTFDRKLIDKGSPPDSTLVIAEPAMPYDQILPLQINPDRKGS